MCMCLCLCWKSVGSNFIIWRFDKRSIKSLLKVLACGAFRPSAYSQLPLPSMLYKRPASAMRSVTKRAPATKAAWKQPSVMKSVLKRASHKCAACGGKGHTVATCSSKAAFIIRQLRSQLRTKAVHRRKPTRQRWRKNKQYAEQARGKYTKQPAAPRLKLVRRQTLKNRRGKGFISGLRPDSQAALSRLQEACYVEKMPNKCPRCRAKGSFSIWLRGGAVWYRCTCYSCRYAFNALGGSRFKGTKLNPVQLYMTIHSYTNSDAIATPHVDDLACACEGGQKAVQRVVDTLRDLECKVARKQNQTGQLSGDLEIDEHCLRSFHVSPKNPKFQRFMTKKLRGKHKYFLNYFRLIGLRKRGGGKVHIAILPPRLLPPRSRPPPLSNEELINSRILWRCKDRSVVLHADGARAYPAVVGAHFKRLRLRSCNHHAMEFVKTIRPVRLPHGTSSSLTGTQTIDSTWGSLENALPRQVKSKRCHDVNPLLEKYVFSWLYRVNRRNTDGFKDLGEHMSE